MDKDQATSSQAKSENVKKSLNSVFAPITEDEEKISLFTEPVDADLLTLDIVKASLNSDEVVEVLDESVVSEAFGLNGDQSSESIESYIGSLNQFISPSPATPSPLTSQFSSKSPAESTPLSSITAEMTPLSSPITAEAVTICVPSHYGATTDEMNLLKVEEVVKHLRESMFQVLHSADIEPRSKRYLDALAKMVIEDSFSLHEERNIVVELFSKKTRIVLLCFALGMLAVSAGLFVFSDVQGYDHGPPPT
ncbi:hypothetical protein CTI12_AA327700 [Artemisia annua]|uniref:Uncharacterized protein n=1 Tax=Artemisia annua TaxID=35608 RepID=A0A2U1MYQ9_ARTAN|nr:hypothetical protein CTI12_AA327700 [Artemisia annua]